MDLEIIAFLYEPCRNLMCFLFFLMLSILKSEYTREEIQTQEVKSHAVHKGPQTQVSVEEKHVEKVTKKTDDKPIGLARLNMKTEKRYALVVYDYWAHNNKELTIRAGEKVLVSWNLIIYRQDFESF